MNKTLKELSRRIRSIKKWKKEVYDNPKVGPITWDLETVRLEAYRDIIKMLAHEIKEK